MCISFKAYKIDKKKFQLNWDNKRKTLLALWLNISFFQLFKCVYKIALF